MEFNLSSRIVNQSAVVTKEYNGTTQYRYPHTVLPRALSRSEKTVKPQGVGVCRLVFLGKPVPNACQSLVASLSKRGQE